MSVSVITGDCLEVMRGMPSQSVHTCVTSPPYWGLRDYGHAGQLGLESTPDAYVAALVGVFREVRRVLRDDGTVWLNLGDSYTPVNRGENAVPRRETMTGLQLGNPHSDLRTRRESIRGVAAMGLKTKDLCGIPWMVAFALRADDWYLRSDIIWSKPNPMPESVTDRPTKAHEYIFLLAKSQTYYYDADAIKEPYAEESFSRYQYAFGGPKSEELSEEGHGRTRPIGMREYKGQATKDYDSAGAQNPSDTKRRILDSMATGEGRNKRTVWTITTKAFPGAHFATFPPDLIEPCILAGCPVGGTVLDPFGGAGTTGLVADRLQRNAILIELNPDYADMARNRVTNDCPLFTEVA